MMYYEAVIAKKNDMVGSLATAYGYKASDAAKIWGDTQNKLLKAKRGTPDKLQVGDTLMIPIPWRVKTQTLDLYSAASPTQVYGVTYIATRDGGLGTQLSWVQTVYQGNQPAASTTNNCVDGCPADDDLPFYWTESELAKTPEFRRKFGDRPTRPAPGEALGTTSWRAITSIAVVTGMRVTVYDSYKWGFDVTPKGVNTKVGWVHASPDEITTHINLLGTGAGTGQKNFGQQGWTFRSPPS